MLYYSVIYPDLIYCASAWSGTFKSLFNPVFIVQKGVIRAMCGPNRRAPFQFFQELGLLKLTEVLKCGAVPYIYRSLANPCLNEFSFQTHVRNTRQGTQALLFVPNRRLTCCRNRIQYRDSATYNEIPINIRQIENYQSFKRNLKKYIKDSRVHHFICISTATCSYFSNYEFHYRVVFCPTVHFFIFSYINFQCVLFVLMFFDHFFCIFFLLFIFEMTQVITGTRVFANM